jgi:hypothetical protein
MQQIDLKTKLEDHLLSDQAPDVVMSDEHVG